MVTHYFEARGGGVEIVAGRLARALSQKPSLKLVWAASDAAHPPHDPDFAGNPVVLPSWDWLNRRCGIPMPVPGLNALRRLLRAVRSTDVLLLHDCLYMTNISAFLMAKWRHVPIMIVQHVAFVPYKNPLLRLLMSVANKLVTSPMLARADQVVFISETTRSHFSTLAYRRQPAVVFNGVDAAIFNPIPTSLNREILRRELGLPSSSPVILFVGRFVEKKGLALLRELSTDRPKITWLFAGSGPLDPRRWSLQNVRVFDDRKGKSLAPLYQAADLFVLPSFGEGYPLVVQEALACCLPILCSDEVAAADPEAEPYLAHLPIDLPDRSALRDQWLAAIDHLLANGGTPRSELEKLSIFARRRYSWQEGATKYYNMLQELTQELGMLNSDTGVQSRA